MLNAKLTNLGANLEMDTLGAQLDGGFIDIYDGAQPVTADTAVTTQTKLARLTFGTPAFAPAVDGVANANPISPEPDAPATGVASWYRMLRSDETPVADGSVGTSGANINLDTVNILIHAVVALDSYQISASKG
jgi:hypothetical protein